MQDEATAAIHFSEGFAQRYGPCHPMFFQGSLDDAMKEAVMQPARDVSIAVGNLPAFSLIKILDLFSV